MNKIASQNRIIALDVFRGLTLALMIVVNMPGAWSSVYAPLLHAQWHGCTLTDLVFPFFLFIVGAAMRFAFEKYDMCLTKNLFRKAINRGITIFIIGLLLNAFPFIRQDWDWSSLRIMGVLQRIGICYFIASIIVLKNDIKDITKIIIGLLFGYWFIMEGYGYIIKMDPYSLNSNAVLALDGLIIGQDHLYKGTGIPFDPEGLLSTIPSIATTLIGFLVGTMIATNKEKLDNFKRMLILGSTLTLLGWIWGLIMPINKQLWTSSYVLFTAGIAIVILALIIWVTDIKKYQSMASPFTILGANSIFLFVLSGLWTKTMLNIKLIFNGVEISGYSYLYQTIFLPFFNKPTSSLLFAVFHLGIFWLILYWMYRKKIFIKI